MTKLFSSVATIFILASILLIITSPAAEAHGDNKLSVVQRAMQWKNRQLFRDRLKRHKDDPELLNLPSIKESLGCLECQIGVGTLVKTLTSATGVNLTLDLINSTVCQKKFGTDPKAAALCMDVATILIKLVSEAFTKAEDGGWNVASDICYDILKQCTADCCTTPYVPEQLTLAFADSVVLSNSMSMRVSWMTLNVTTGDFISYQDASSSSNPWMNISSSQISQKNSIPDESWSFYGMFHSGVMVNLKPNTTYNYFVGSSNGQYVSSTFSFTTLPLNVGTPERPLRVAAFADMGTINSQDTVNGIVAGVKAGQIDFVFGTGDLGYSDMNLERFSEFGRLIEPFAAYVPFMTVPGNHEANFLLNFSQYRHRWIMPSAGPTAPADAMFYTFSVGPVNFFQINTETFIDTADIGEAELNWMPPLMAKADSTPGTFSMINQHRPLYCSTHSAACYNGKESTWLREEVEYLYYSNHIDFVFTGHVHYLESQLPVKEGQVAGDYTANQSIIEFPTAPTYFVGGNAGQEESLTSCDNAPSYKWSRMCRSVIGYQLLEFVQMVRSDNKLHTSMKITALQSNNSAILDQFTIISSR